MAVWSLWLRPLNSVVYGWLLAVIASTTTATMATARTAPSIIFSFLPVFFHRSLALSVIAFSFSFMLYLSPGSRTAPFTG